MDFSELTDEQLAFNLQQDKWINESLQELVTRHSGIYYKIVNKYVPEQRLETSKFNIDKDLLLGSRDYIIYEAAKKFDPTKRTKFSTFLGNRATYECLNHLNSARKYQSFETNEFENIVHNHAAERGEDSNIFEISDDIDEDIINKILEIIKKFPDKRVEDIFRLRYLESRGKRPTPWSEIYQKIPHARQKNRHLTIQGCINLHDKALDEIRRQLTEER